MFNKRRGRRKQNNLWMAVRKMSRGKKIALGIGIFILLILVIAGSYVAWAISRLGDNEVKEEEIIVNEEVQEKVDLGDGYMNFVLFGSDSREGNVETDLNTDTIIIFSLNNETKEIKMVSVYRDTLMDLTNGRINKCNSAYALGGATQAISMLNTNMDLQLKKYVTIDFSIVVDVIDILGGIEVDVSEAEMEELNNHLGHTASMVGQTPNYLTHSGLQLLDGAQATTYARIRKGVGDDFARTERQRLVIQKIAEKAIASGIGTIHEIIDTVFPKISTNFTMVEILKYAQWFDEYTFGETSGFPFEYGSETIPGKGSCVYALDLTKDVSKLHELLFGTLNYEPTSVVGEIGSEVDSVVQSAVYKPSTQNSSPSSSGSQTQQPTTPTTPETTPTTPSTPETTPSTPETTPSTPETTPSTPETTPSTPETPPTTPETTPTTPETTPTTPDTGTTTTPDSNSGNTTTGQTTTQ